MPRPRALPVEYLDRTLAAVGKNGLPVREILVTPDGARIIIGESDVKGRGEKVPSPWLEDD